MQVRDEARARFPQLAGRVRFIAISFEPAEALARHSSHLAPDLFEICSDSQRRAYAAFELPRLGLPRILAGRTLRFYASRILRGNLPRGLGGDVHQMGGDFILDAGGIVRFAYVSREPADRPEPGVLLRDLARWNQRP